MRAHQSNLPFALLSLKEMLAGVIGSTDCNEISANV